MKDTRPDARDTYITRLLARVKPLSDRQRDVLRRLISTAEPPISERQQDRLRSAVSTGDGHD